MGLAHNLSECQRTDDIKVSQNVTFDTMLLSPTTLDGLKNSGFFKPSPIQLHGIPLGKCGFDLLLEAKSGTGKTAVFTIIMLEKIDVNKGLQVIVIAPTREIAAQICDVICNVGCFYDGLRVEVVMGGLPVQDDIEKFKENKVHIVVGSPGRLKHLIKDDYMDTNAVRLLVIDEADKLMEKSFLPDIKFIYSTLPHQKQVIMSSATYPEGSKEFINKFVHDAQHICPSSNCVLLGVVQKVTYVKYNSNTVLQTQYRFKELLKIISKKQFKQCLIFCNYQVRTGEVHKMLTKEKWPAEQLYGAQDQIDRLDAIKTLQQYKCRILISTDLAARGIDASNVDLVINFEPPFDWQTYLHRIGRAGRFGSYGMAVTILSKGVEQQKFLNLLAAVNFSDYLLPLWNENDDINDKGEDDLSLISKSTDSEQLINGSEDQNYTKLWDIICQNEVPSEGNVESFNELCNSFEKATTIESFSDLLNSFETNNSTDNKDFQYKCIELPNISAKQYLGNIKNELDVDIKHSDNALSDIKTPKSVSNPTRIALGDINNQVEVVSEQSDVIGEINEQLQCVTKHSEDTNKIKNHIDGLSKQIENVPKRNKNSLDHISKHSKDVFGLIGKQSELHSNHSSEVVDTYTKKFKNRTEIAQVDKTNVNKAAEINKKISPNISKQKLIHESVNSRSPDINPEIKQTNKSKNRSAKHNRGETVALNYYNTHSSKSYSTEKHKVKQTQTYSVDNSYINWYSQLKYRVRQIELASYIDELSKQH